MPFRPLHVDAEAAIEAERCRCLVLCLCHKSLTAWAAWEQLIADIGPNDHWRRRILLDLEERRFAMAAADLLDD